MCVRGPLINTTQMKEVGDLACRSLSQEDTAFSAKGLGCLRISKEASVAGAE